MGAQAIVASGLANGPTVVDGFTILGIRAVPAWGIDLSGSFDGGGAFLSAYDATVQGNTFVACTAPSGSHAAALWIDHSINLLENNLFADCTGAPAVEKGSYGRVTPSCNVFWNNPDGDVTGFTLSSSDRSADPLFCDPATDDPSLAASSPCLPAADPACGQVGAFGEGCGAVSVQARSWGAVKAGYR